MIAASCRFAVTSQVAASFQLVRNSLICMSFTCEIKFAVTSPQACWDIHNSLFFLHGMVLNTSLQWVRLNLDQISCSQQTPHSSPWGELWGVYCKYFGENDPCYYWLFCCQLHIANATLAERSTQLATLQRDLDQRKVSYDTLDENYRREKVSIVSVKFKSGGASNWNPSLLSRKGFNCLRHHFELYYSHCLFYWCIEQLVCPIHGQCN